MGRSQLPRVILLAAAIALIGLAGCAKDTRPSPKETVKGLFTAMRNSDTLFLTTNIDLPVAAKTLGDELAADSIPGDHARTLLGELTGDGKLRKRWLENQIVLGESQVSADTAWVEVSFIDRLTRVQYYNKMRLDFRRDRWVINSFRTL